MCIMMAVFVHETAKGKGEDGTRVSSCGMNAGGLQRSMRIIAEHVVSVLSDVAIYVPLIHIQVIPW